MKTLLHLLLALIAGAAQAQHNGPYDNIITFRGHERTVAIFVPEGYVPGTAAPLLVGLHGFNQSPQAFRDIIKPIAEERNAIIVCPDGNGNRHDDEYAQFENGEMVTREIDLIHTVLDSAFQWFSIDNSRVILTGFSYGGRESLYFGLEHFYKFQGVIALSPAIQSAADANNQLPVPWPRPFQFNNQQHIPICICAGEQDDYFVPHIKSFYQKISEAEGADTLILREHGHTTAYPEFEDDFAQCWNFIERNEATTQVAGIPYQVSPHIYPNPASDVIQLDFGTSFTGQIRLFSSSGQMLLESSVLKCLNTELQVGHLPRGMYSIQFISETECQSSFHWLR